MGSEYLEPKVDVQEALSRVSAQFHHDVFEIYGSVENVLAHVGDCLSKTERPVMREYLFRALQSNRERRRIYRAWKDANPDFFCYRWC